MERWSTTAPGAGTANGSPTAFVEIAANEIIAKRMNKKQQITLEQNDGVALPRRADNGAERYV